MTRLSAAALASILLLGACAGEAPLISEKRPMTAPGGLWEVTDATLVETSGAAQAPYLGQRLALERESAGDAAGRLCKTPLYQAYEAPADLVLGTKGDRSHRPVLEVVCEGEIFGTYVGTADGTMQTRANAWLLTLKRGAKAESAAPSPVTETSAPPPAPAASLAPAPPTPTPASTPAPAPAQVVKAQAKPAGTLVYLASYKTIAAARAGFERLAKHSATLAKAPLVLKNVDLGAKGKWVRLFAQTADAAQGKSLCAQLAKRLPSCGSAWAK